MVNDHPDWDFQRQRMVDEQLVPRGIRDPRVLEAMRTIPRHAFVPESVREDSYADHPLPIGGGQTISQPYIVAMMSELLHLDGSERILEIGAGCGYQTAVLASLARCVCALELDECLANAAREHLAGFGAPKVDLRRGDGFLPWPGGGEFDGILCACAPRELPPALLDQLALGGRLVIPIGSPGTVQTLFCHHRRHDAGVEIEHREPVRFVPMRSSRSLS
jgi:protein-L-isoaspartate(D-aspartate) O-methyltransferase